jgi:ATP-binding cassette, subfamily C, bacterial LapB
MTTASQPSAHWFWSVIAENRALYRDVLLAAFMINLFALALPLFTMNVYDRVVPNRAIETLWMLAAGLLLVLVADLVLRSMRGYFLDLASSRVDVRLSAHIMERVLGLRMKPAGCRPARSPPTCVLRVGARLHHLGHGDRLHRPAVRADLPAGHRLDRLADADPPIVLRRPAVAAYALAVHSKMHELSRRLPRRRDAQCDAGREPGRLEAIKALGAESVMQRKWERARRFSRASAPSCGCCRRPPMAVDVGSSWST